MYCSNCGTKFEGKFCPECGTPAVTQSSGSQDVIYQQPAQQQINHQQPIPLQPLYLSINQNIVPTAPPKQTGISVTKTIIGIICLIIFIIIFLQSCAVGCVNLFEENTEDTTAGVGLFVAFFYLVIGIVSTAGRSNRGASLAVSIISAITAIIGFSTSGTYVDLIVWSSLSVILAVLYLIFFIFQKSANR
ncbi:MAG: AmiS/UreI family transporter [Bacillota bacterium]|nr:AmiS/UreI family transporter [Bacillota bacterium]